MMTPVYIAPSVLAADFGNLEKEIQSVLQAGADWIHIDVMDGHFVPPITFGDKMVEIAKKNGAFCDVHLMIKKPENQFDAFVKAGANRIIIHQEACLHLYRTIEVISGYGIKAGVAINPATPVETVFNVLEICDLVLVMTVNPGWGGQKFINSTLEKIKKLSQEIKKRNLSTIIEVDGGIDSETAKLCFSAGATAFVCGTYIFGHLDYKKAIDSLKP